MALHRSSTRTRLLAASLGALACGAVVPGAAVAADGRTLTTWGFDSNTGAMIGVGLGFPLAQQTYVPAAGPVTDVIAAGQGHVLAVRPDGHVVAWGRNDRGQLGDGTTTGTGTATDARPVAVQGLPAGVAAVSLAAGRDHSVAVLADGSVWAWGDEREGELGSGISTARRTVAQRVPGISNATRVAAAVDATAVVLADGTVRTFGINTTGQLGNGSLATSGTPQTVRDTQDATGELTGVVDVVGGSSTFLALRTDGTLRAWGNDFAGQLGDGETRENRTSAVGVVSPGDPTQPLGGVTQIAAGAQHFAAIQRDDDFYGTPDYRRLLVWGSNAQRQLTSPYADTDLDGDSYGTPHDHGPVQTGSIVAAGRAATYLQGLPDPGFVSAWGSNLDGQILAVDAFGNQDPDARFGAIEHSGAHRVVAAPLADYVLSVDTLPATADAPTVTFVDQAAGSTSASRTVTVRGGEATQRLQRARLLGAGRDSFVVSSDDCDGTALPAGGTCTVKVRFVPDGPGEHAATLRIDGAGREPLDVALHGTGLDEAAGPVPGPAGAPGPTGAPGTGTPGPAGPAGARGPAGRAPRIAVSCGLVARRTAVRCTVRPVGSSKVASPTLRVSGGTVRAARAARSTVRARLTRAGRRTLRRGRTLRVSVTATVGTGERRTVVTVRVPVAR